MFNGQLMKFQEKHENEFEENVPAEAYSYWGMEAIEKGEYEEAIKYFEEAFIRGKIHMIDCIMATYDDILKMYSFEEYEKEYWDYRLEQAQKMQQYGKIIEYEIKSGRVY